MTEAAEKAIRLWEAQDKAEQEGKNEFICPSCGGKAWWSRSEYNGYTHYYTCHYNIKGNKCGIGILHKCKEKEAIKDRNRRLSNGRT